MTDALRPAHEIIRDRAVLEADCPRCHQHAGSRCVDIYSHRPFTSGLTHHARVAVWYKQRGEAEPDGV